MRFCKSISSKLNLGILIGGTLLLLISFNMLSGLFLSGLVFDTTPDKRFSLSAATRDFLNRNTMPLNIRLYVSQNIKKHSSGYGALADYLNRLFAEYAAAGHGLLRFNAIEVAPFSSSEAEAKAAGLTTVKTADTERELILGSVITDGLGRSITIPEFDLKRLDVMEDDLTRRLSILNSAKLPLLGVISPEFNIASQDSILNLDNDWPFIRRLKNDGFRVLPMRADAPSIPEDVDVLLLFYPQHMSPLSLYAIEQYLLSGGNVMVMMDAFFSPQFDRAASFEPSRSAMDGFLSHHGITYYEDVLVADGTHHRDFTFEGHLQPNPFYPEVVPENMENHPIMRGIHRLWLQNSSIFTYQAQNPDLSLTLLFTTGKQSAVSPVSSVFNRDFAQLKHSLHYQNQPMPLAVLLEGRFKPFYTMPPITDAAYLSQMPLFKTEAAASGRLLLVGDSDMALSSLWLGDYTSSGEFYSSDNMLFIRNALDYLSSDSLTSVGRKAYNTPAQPLQDVISEMAAKHFAARRTQLLGDLADRRAAIAELRRKHLSDDLKLPVKLQQRQHNLQKEIDHLEYSLQKITYRTEEFYNNLLTFFTIALMIIPTLSALGVVAVGYFCFRRLRQRQLNKGKK